jgi:hypothetical protein
MALREFLLWGIRGSSPLNFLGGRTYILIHSGNWAGDVSKDLNTHTNGCILLGMKRGYLAGQRAVLMSRTAIRKFMDRLDGANFKLHILEVF